jgi:hypothetical protein
MEGSAEQVDYGGAVVESVWATGIVRECGFVGNAKSMECGSPEVVWRNGFFAGVAGNFVAFAEYGASANATAGDEGVVAPRMMFPSGIGDRDLGAASEFAGPDDEGVVEQTAVIQVFENRGEGLIGGRDQVAFESLEVVAVCIPEVLAIVVPVDGNEGNAMFEEPASEEDGLSMDVAAVAITGSR